MQGSKIVAIIAGAISIILAIAYLLIVQLLDFRGEMLPAPQSLLLERSHVEIAYDFNPQPAILTNLVLVD